MKKTFLVLIPLGAISTLAQITPSPASAVQQSLERGTNQQEVAVFSSPNGQSFSAEQLAAQLQSLRSIVEQTLPVLGAFNQNYSNSLGGNQSIGGAISGLLSGALNKNQQSSSASAAHSSLSVSNVLASLQNLVSTNRTSSAPVSPNTLRDLVTLQNELHLVLSSLQNLNVGNLPGNQFAQPSSGTNTLTPTGR